MLYNDSGPIPGFSPRKKDISEEKNIERWVSLAVWGTVGVIGILLILGVVNNNPCNYYPEDTQKCFSRLTTLDHSLVKESDPHTLVKEIKKDILKNHLVPLCGSTYENMDDKMIQVFFPNVLFDPTGI